MGHERVIHDIFQQGSCHDKIEVILDEFAGSVPRPVIQDTITVYSVYSDPGSAGHEKPKAVHGRSLVGLDAVPDLDLGSV
jgi:hypothetical protein